MNTDKGVGVHPRTPHQQRTAGEVRARRRWFGKLRVSRIADGG